MDWETYIESTADLMALPIDPAWKPGIVGFLALAGEMAATLDRVELDDAELTLAPVYSPDAFGPAAENE
ncbi:MAG: DUF4089 domain-containing protein [Pseudomonadota bacterium]